MSPVTFLLYRLDSAQTYNRKRCSHFDGKSKTCEDPRAANSFGDLPGQPETYMYKRYICIRVINKRISMLYPGWIKRCALPSSPRCRDGCRDRSRCYRCHLDLRSACGASHPWPWNRSEAQDFIFLSPSGNHSEACSFTCHASAISDCYPALLEGSRTDKYVSVTSWGGSAHSMLKAIFGAICSCPAASADCHVGASTY